MSHRTSHCGRGGRIESLEQRRLLAVPGTLDTSFSLDGKLTVDLGFDRPAGAYTFDAADVAVQADGKTVVAGTWRPANNNEETQRDFAVVRFNVDGTLDQTFGGGSAGTPNGFFFIHLGNRADPDEKVTSLAIGLDGKIVVAGMTRVARTLTQDTLDFAVIRLLPNGVLDNSFDGDGYRTIQFDGDTHAIANDVAVRSDGTIILVGETRSIDITPPTQSISDSDFAIAILNVDGSLQSQGRRVFGFGGNETDDSAHAVTIDPAGNIIVVGGSEAQGGSFAVARLKPNGDFDTSFGSGGRLFTPLPGRALAEALDVLAQGDKIVVVGKSVTNVTRRSEMVRYLANGQLDPLFGAGGVFVVETPGLFAANAIIRSADGGLIVGGEGSGGFVIAGYTANGVLNSAFGTAGLVTTPFNETTPILSGLARGPGRRFVATGGALSPTARYLDADARKVTAGALDSLAIEGSTNTGTLIVGRTENLPFATRVFFSIGGTATISNTRTGTRDYSMPGLAITSVFTPTSGSGFVDIPANQSFVILTLTTVNDTLKEVTESAIFTILSSSTYEIGTPSSGTINIQDDDTPSFRVGTTTVAKPPKHVGVGQELQAAVTWTVPTGEWRQLSTIQLRLRDWHDDNALAILTFDEATNSFSVESTPGAGNSPVSLILSKCTFQAAGPDAPTVTVIFTFVFNAAAAKTRFRLDVAADNDAGEFSGFEQIGELHVHKKPKGHGLFLPL